MKLHYHPRSESLTIELSAGTGTTAREISPGIVADFDDAGHVIGLDIALENGGLIGSQLETIALLSADL